MTANQTSSFRTSDIDPGVRGYIVAVAVDGGTGRLIDRAGSDAPINFNWLIGDLFVKLPSGHAANLGAEGIAAVGTFDTGAAVSLGSVAVPLSFSNSTANQSLINGYR